MSEELQDFSPQVLEKAIENNIIEQYPLAFSSLPQFNMHQTDDFVWYTTNIPHPYFNCVLRARFIRDKIDSQIEAILSEFRSHNMPLTWSVGPTSLPPDLGFHLSAQGLSHVKDEVGMALDLKMLRNDLSPPAKLNIMRVVNEKMLREWFRIVNVSFGYPYDVAELLFDLYVRVSLNLHQAWQLYIGYFNRKPVGASRLFLGAGVAGIYHVATIPESRNQGIGTAMTLEPLREARSMGYRIGVLRAAKMAKGVYERLGFKEYCLFHFYVYT